MELAVIWGSYRGNVRIMEQKTEGMSFACLNHVFPNPAFSAGFWTVMVATFDG